MDVRCERCGTEYEFEDSRVTEEGVTVKCSTCGHLFKIRKKSFVLTEPVMLGKKGVESPQERNWMVRKADGTVLSFKELTTLQKWIVERKVSRDDEISKSGETWKRLGGIAELASFFQVVDAATTGTMQAAPLSAVPLQAPTTQPLPAAAPPTALPAHSTQPLPAATPPYQPTPPEPAFVPQSPAPLPAQAPLSAPPYPSQPSEPDSWGESGYAAADDDVVEKWKKRGRRKWFIIIPLAVVVVGLGLWYLVSPQSFVGVIRAVVGKSKAISELAQAKFNSGRAHFLKDSDAELDVAMGDLNAAISEADGRYPEALAVLGEVYVTRAARRDIQITKLDAKVLELDEQMRALRPPDGSEPKGELKKKILPLHNQKVEIQKERNVLVDEARKDLDEAKRYIDAAKELAPQALAPKRAHADYLRVLKAGRPQVEGVLKDAQALKPEDPETLYVEGAMYAGDPAALGLAAEKLNRAVVLNPELVRARYLLAEVLIGQGKLEEARIHLQRIVQESPGHELASTLLATLEKPEVPMPEKPPQPAAPGNFEELMAKAQGLQDREQPKKALEVFEAALKIQPDDFKALTGMGFCYFDLGQMRNAIQSFRQALKQNSRHPGAIIGLAEVYKEMGDRDQAVEFYQRYLEVFPNGPDAPVAERNIKELQ